MNSQDFLGGQPTIVSKAIGLVEILGREVESKNSCEIQTLSKGRMILRQNNCEIILPKNYSASFGGACLAWGQNYSSIILH